MYVPKFSLLLRRNNSLYIWQIILQTIFSLLLAVYGVTMVAGDFKEIRSNIDLQKKYVFFHLSK